LTQNLIQLSTELDLLAACDQGCDEFLACKAQKAVQSGIDWARFEKLVVGHGMGGLVCARLMSVAPRVLPSNIVDLLHALLRQHTVLHLIQTAESARLTRCLDAGGVRSIILKGAAVAHLLYAPTPEWRASSDIDILVPEEDLLLADRILTKAGYIRAFPAGDLPKAGLDMLLLLANTFSYSHAHSDLVVELHHRIAPNPYWLPFTFDEFYGQSKVIETGKGSMRGLDGSLLLGYLCWHALGHIGYRLKWFGDVARMLRHIESDGRGDIAIAVRYPSMARSIDLACEVVAALYETAAEPHESTVVAWRSDVARILGGLERPVEIFGTRNIRRLTVEWSNVRFLMRLSPDRRSKAYQLLRTASDPRDVATLGLGKRWLIVYTLAGPPLAAWRFVRRLTLTILDARRRVS
jgi:hypothetical protein